MFGSTPHNHQLMTNSFMKIILLLIIGFAAAAIAMPATSHQPVLAIGEPHAQEQPFEIEEPEISKAIYSKLDGSPNFYRVMSDKSFIFSSALLSQYLKIAHLEKRSPLTY